MTDYQLDEVTGYIITKGKKTFTPAMKTSFLKILHANVEKNPLRFDVQQAADEIGVARRTIYQHTQMDEKFGLDFWDIRDKWLDNHEMNVEDFGKKNFVASLAVLKANRPMKWREKQVIQQDNSKDNMSLVLKRMKEKGYLKDVTEVVKGEENEGKKG
jgi:hypothetical protein